MGISGSPDIFQVQEKMADLMYILVYVRTYIDDLHIITRGRGTSDNHLIKVEEVLS